MDVHDGGNVKAVFIGGTLAIEYDDGKYSVAAPEAVRGCGSICSLIGVDPSVLYLPILPTCGGSL